MVSVYFNGSFFLFTTSWSFWELETLLEGASIKGGADTLPTPKHP